jgi:hypothetical protein
MEATVINPNAVLPSQVQFDSAFALLAVIGDPNQARARLDELQVQVCELKTLATQLAEEKNQFDLLKAQHEKEHQRRHEELGDGLSKLAVEREAFDLQRKEQQAVLARRETDLENAHGELARTRKELEAKIAQLRKAVPEL